MRMVIGLLSLLVLASPAVAQAAVGYVAQGKATVRGARGVENGVITVEIWGANHCRIRLDVSRGSETRVWTAVLDGKHVRVSGPRSLVQALAVPDPAHGCALLPLSDQPASLAWQSAAGEIELAYSAYTAAGYPAQVNESVGGAIRLTVALTSLTTRTDFSEADFALKSPPVPATHGHPGGSQ